MPDAFRQSLLDFEAVPPVVVLVRLLTALLLGGVAALIYRLTRSKSEVAPSFTATLVLLSILIAMVTQAVGDNVARAFSLVGALSIVRFRTVVEDTRDTAFVIFAVVVGMAVGSQQPWVAVLGLLVGGGASFALAWREARSAAQQAPQAMVLRLRVSVGTEMDLLLAQSLGDTPRRMLSLATGKQGTSLEAAYEIVLDKNKSPEELVKQLHRMDGVFDVRLTVRGEDSE